MALQRYLAYKKTPAPRTLQSPCAQERRMVLGVDGFYERGTPVYIASLLQRLASAMRKVDIRLSGKGNSNSHGAGPVY